jgi:hypothetical protein
MLLVVLTPLLAVFWPPWLVAVWIQLPIYMLHQFEEHDGDRFQRFVTANLGQGRELLSHAAIWVINVPGVWGVIAVSLGLAVWVRPGLGLIAVYLVLVNALAHIAAGVVLRRFNPGLVTAVVLFLPGGIWGLLALRQAGATAADHAIGLAVAVAIHLAIVAFANRFRLAGLVSGRG